MPTSNPQEPFKRISVLEAKKMIDKGDVQLIDVRQMHEYVSAHIDGSKLIPVDVLFGRINEVAEDKDVIFHCAAGVRSALACEMAAAMGRTRCYNMEGGMEAWKAQKMPFHTGAH
ncbi:MAG: rhodanese-like protein [Dehalococcoidia bacterium]|nr:rhodanese-like protein [Dehalococcoidia bacterium]